MLYIKKEDEKYTKEEVAKIKQDFGFSELTAKILLSKGIKTYEQIMSYINTDSILVTPNSQLPNCKEAVERIENAMMTGEKIAVYGDYDVDGICGVSIVINSFKDFGYDEIEYYIPNRIKEGYGMNKDAVDIIKEKGCSLIITVDCGISNKEEIDYANELGINVVVTDHHMPPEVLPDAICVNPKLGTIEDTKRLCGAAVAMKLMCELFDEGVFHEYCDLAAIATIADMVDLVGENRKIVKSGLEKINERTNPNIAHLVDECIKNKKTIKSDDVAYFIAPSINAAGRLDQADKCVDLFINSCQMPQEAAAILAHDNYNRRKIEKETIKQAIELLDKINLAETRAIILYDERWHPGVLGIAASKIKNIYFRPVILLTKNNSSLVGSARSVDDVDMHEAIKYCSSCVKKFGGHFMAAGLSLDEDKLEDFKIMFEEYLSRYDDSLFYPNQYYDVKAHTSQINMDFINELEILEPFGKGNPSPTLLLEDVTIEDYRTMGSEGQHFRCKLNNDGMEIPAVAFSSAICSYDDKKFEAIISPNVNEWNGNISVQAQLRDIKPSVKEIDSWKKYIENLDDYFDLTLSQSFYDGNTIIDNACLLDDALIDMKSTTFGRLLLILDKDAAMVGFSTLGNLIDMVDIRIGQIEKTKLNTNTILIAPDVEGLDTTKYDKVYIFSTYKTEGLYKLLHPQHKMFIIRDYINREMTNNYYIEIERLREIFKEIRSLALRFKLDNNINGINSIRCWEMRMALKIFIEVGLVAKRDSIPKYTLVNKKQVKIEDSKTYQNVIEGK
jgi:single-stranded-DNA-specific exonuclease